MLHGDLNFWSSARPMLLSSGNCSIHPKLALRITYFNPSEVELNIILVCSCQITQTVLEFSHASVVLAVSPSVSSLFLASHADVPRVRHACLAHERLLTWAEKNVYQSQQTSRSGKCTLDLEKFRAWLYSSKKDQKGLMKGEDLTVLEQTTQLTHKRSY